MRKYGNQIPINGVIFVSKCDSIHTCNALQLDLKIGKNNQQLIYRFQQKPLVHKTMPQLPLIQHFHSRTSAYLGKTPVLGNHSSSFEYLFPKNIFPVILAKQPSYLHSLKKMHWDRSWLIFHIQFHAITCVSYLFVFCAAFNRLTTNKHLFSCTRRLGDLKLQLAQSTRSQED